MRPAGPRARPARPAGRRTQRWTTSAAPQIAPSRAHPETGGGQPGVGVYAARVAHSAVADHPDQAGRVCIRNELAPVRGTSSTVPAGSTNIGADLDTSDRHSRRTNRGESRMPFADLPLDELREYRPAVACPDDFDDFWTRTLAEAACHDIDTDFLKVDA